jgi:hypothetical protein
MLQGRLWLLALATGPTASRCSTPVLVLASGRIGCTVPLRFVEEVGTVLLHWSGVRPSLHLQGVAAGLAVH